MEKTPEVQVSLGHYRGSNHAEVLIERRWDRESPEGGPSHEVICSPSVRGPPRRSPFAIVKNTATADEKCTEGLSAERRGIPMMRPRRFVSGFFLFLFWMAHTVPAEAQLPAVRSVGDAKGQFTIDFPADWHVVKPESGSIAVMGVAPVMARSNPVSNPASVNVVVEGLPRAMSPETYAAVSERMLRAVFHDYTPIQQGTATLAGQRAYYRYYTWQANTGQILYQVQVYFTVGQKGFVVTGSTLNDPDHTRVYLPIIAQIIDTFRPIIKGSAPCGAALFIEPACDPAHARGATGSAAR
jgi:hypothetical protein